MSRRRMVLPDKMIRRFRRRVAWWIFLKYALPLATAYALVWGAVVLALRATAGVERRPLLWGLLGLAGCLAVAIHIARRNMPTLQAIRALLDEQNGCGGLLMAQAETDLGDWQHRLPELTPPQVRWEGRRAGALFSTAACFVLLAFLAPQGLAEMQSNSPLEIDREIGRLLQQIALLKGESILEPKRAEELTEKTAELQDHSSGKDPSRTLEALDHLRNLTHDAARQSAEQSTQQTQNLSDGQALSKALQNKDFIDPKLLKDLLSKLDSLASKEGLPPEVKQGLGQGKFNPEQLEKLLGALQGYQGELQRRVEKLRGSGLIDAETLARFHRAGESKDESLRPFLRDRSSRASSDNLKNQGIMGNDRRRPGTATLTWNKSGSEEESKFQEEALPPRALDWLRSKPHQETREAGTILNKSAETASSGALQGASVGNGSSNNIVVLPRHRAAVQRYFDRKSETRSPKSERNSKSK